MGWFRFQAAGPVARMETSLLPQAASGFRKCAQCCPRPSTRAKDRRHATNDERKPTTLSESRFIVDHCYPQLPLSTSDSRLFFFPLKVRIRLLAKAAQTYDAPLKILKHLNSHFRLHTITASASTTTCRQAKIISLHLAPWTPSTSLPSPPRPSSPLANSMGSVEPPTPKWALFHINHALLHAISSKEIPLKLSEIDRHAPNYLLAPYNKANPLRPPPSPPDSPAPLPKFQGSKNSFFSFSHFRIAF